jgi:hypothetical protein
MRGYGGYIMEYKLALGINGEAEMLRRLSPAGFVVYYVHNARFIVIGVTHGKIV